MPYYTIRQVIGEGGMGSVYLARDRRTDLDVAIKVISGRFSDSEVKQRFVRETQILSSLNHRNIVRFFESTFSDAGEPCLVMEFLDGVDFRAFDGTPYPILLPLMSQVLLGMDYLRSQGIIHRDLSSNNILVIVENATRLAKILDFGIAKALSDSGDADVRTQTGQFLGKFAFSSPESLLGAPVDWRSDIYSLGVIFYRLLAKEPPIKVERAGNYFEWVMAHQKPKAPLFPTPPGCPSIPPELKALVLRMLDPDPEERPQNYGEAMEVIDALRVTAPETAEVPSYWLPRSVARVGEEPGRPDAMLLPGESALPASPTMTARGEDTAVPYELLKPSPPRKSSVPPKGRSAPPSSDYSGRVDPFGGTRGAPGGARESEGSRVSTPVSGQVVGRFTLHELLSRGRTGPLFKAYDEVRGELVGLKVVENGDDMTRLRLLRAGRLWLGLKHANLVSILEVHPDYGGYPAVIVSELVDGVPLSALREGPSLSVARVLDIGTQLCEGLAYMHSRGVIHREVRPQNILVTVPDYHVKLLDSGIARHANPEVDAFTKTGIVVGDLLYSPPELAHGKADQRADLYAVGVILFELLTGGRPRSPEKWASFDRLECLDHVPSALRDIVRRALAPASTERFVSAEELREALGAIYPHRTEAGPFGTTVVMLHGIRTHAEWQRTFSEVAGSRALRSRSDRWHFGYFSVLRFLSPWSRLAKVRWFRSTYTHNCET